MLDMNTEDITKIELQANLKIIINQLNDTFEDVDDEWVARGKVKDDLLAIKECVQYLRTLTDK